MQVAKRLGASSRHRDRARPAPHAQQCVPTSAIATANRHLAGEPGIGVQKRVERAQLVHAKHMRSNAASWRRSTQQRASMSRSIQRVDRIATTLGIGQIEVGRSVPLIENVEIEMNTDSVRINCTHSEFDNKY